MRSEYDPQPRRPAQQQAERGPSLLRAALNALLGLTRVTGRLVVVVRRGGQEAWAVEAEGGAGLE